MMTTAEQLAVHPRRPIEAELVMDGPDLEQQRLVSRRPASRRPGDPLDPVVVARAGNAQHPAHHADPQATVLGLLRRDVAVDLYWSLRRAKKASAFPRISSSSCFCASSRFKRAISARSSDRASPAPLDSLPCLFSAARTQFATVVGDRSNSLPMSTNVRPPWRNSSTIWSLNSGANTVPIRTPSCGLQDHVDGVRHIRASPPDTSLAADHSQGRSNHGHEQSGPDALPAARRTSLCPRQAADSLSQGQWESPWRHRPNDAPRQRSTERLGSTLTQEPKSSPAKSY